MKKLIIISLFCLIFSRGFAVLREQLPADVRLLYRILLVDKNYEKKKAAVESLMTLFVKKKNPAIVDVAIDLLKYRYEKENFKEENQVMYYDDQIARRLVDILKLSRDKKGFGTLLKIVVVRQHTDKTIMHAWDAIQNIDWH